MRKELMRVYPILLLIVIFSIIWTSVLLFAFPFFATIELPPEFILTLSIPHTGAMFIMFTLFEIAGGLAIWKYGIAPLKVFADKEPLLRTFMIWASVMLLFVPILLILTLAADIQNNECQESYNEAKALDPNIQTFNCPKTLSPLAAELTAALFLGPHNPVFLFLSLYIARHYLKWEI